MVEKKLRRNHKDSVFRAVFNDEDKLRELYNALEGTDYGKDVPIVIETLENALFVDVANDLGFQIGNKYVVLIEMQSTVCPNMPYRMLGYTARTFDNLYVQINFFSKQQKKIMAPEFYVLYNGKEPIPDNLVLRLSDSYVDGAPENSLEIVVKVINVGYNKGEENEVLKKSPTLYQYSRFVQIVRETLDGRTDKDVASREAVLKARQEGLLPDFFKKYGSEAADMAYSTFNQEEYIEQLKADFYEDGINDGRDLGIKEAHLETARTMKSKGFDTEIICDCTGLTPEEVEKI